MGLFPVLAVLLFAMAVVAAISYLRMEEMQAEQQSVQRDGEHSRQRVNLRLAERQEQLQKFGRELQPELASPAAFADRVSLLSLDNPEVLDVTWLNLDGKARASKEMHDTAGYPLPRPGMGLPLPQEQVLLDEVRKSRQARYVVVTRHEGEDAFLAFMLPLGQRDAPDSFLYARYNLSSLLYYAIPSDVFASYAVSLMDAHKRVVAGQSVNPDDEKIAWWQLWSSMHSSVYNAPLATVDNVLTLHLRAYRAHEDRIAIGRRLRQDLRAEVVRRTGPVVDDEGLARGIVSLSPTTRAMMSMAPPGGAGTMILTARVG